MIVVITACQHQREKIAVDVTNVLDSGKSFDSVLQVCFQSLPSENIDVKRQSYLISQNEVVEENDTYTMGCFQNYPDSSLSILQYFAVFWHISSNSVFASCVLQVTRGSFKNVANIFSHRVLQCPPKPTQDFVFQPYFPMFEKSSVKIIIGAPAQG